MEIQPIKRACSERDLSLTKDAKNVPHAPATAVNGVPPQITESGMLGKSPKMGFFQNRVNSAEEKKIKIILIV